MPEIPENLINNTDLHVAQELGCGEVVRHRSPTCRRRQRDCGSESGSWGRGNLEESGTSLITLHSNGLVTGKRSIGLLVI